MFSQEYIINICGSMEYGGQTQVSLSLSLDLGIWSVCEQVMGINLDGFDLDSFGLDFWYLEFLHLHSFWVI